MAKHGAEYEAELIRLQGIMDADRARLGGITEGEWWARLSIKMQKALDHLGIPMDRWGPLADEDWFRLSGLRVGAPAITAFLRWREITRGPDEALWAEAVAFFRQDDDWRNRRWEGLGEWPRWARVCEESLVPQTPLTFLCARCDCWQLPQRGRRRHRCFCCGFAPAPAPVGYSIGDGPGDPSEGSP